jgi:hypothetical protein
VAVIHAIQLLLTGVLCLVKREGIPPVLAKAVSFPTCSDTIIVHTSHLSVHSIHHKYARTAVNQSDCVASVCAETHSVNTVNMLLQSQISTLSEGVRTKTCWTIWQRDVDATRNMTLLKALYLVYQIDRPDEYSH